MKKIILSLLVVFGLSACAFDRTPVLNTADVTKVDFSRVSSMKKGTSCSNTVLMFIGPFGSQEITKAAQSANISKVEILDYKTTAYGPFFAKSCIIVYGH